jgi:hypothetical protein
VKRRPHRNSALLARPGVMGAAVVGAPDRHVGEVPVTAVTRIVQTVLKQHRFHGQVATRLGDGRAHATIHLTAPRGAGISMLAAGPDRYPFTCVTVHGRAEE